ncbi:MAG: cbb3-type cytochrome oxidase assembly protein CcoS [Paracoccaceae bacterium]
MNILVLLIPISISLGALGLWAFFWSLRNNQYDDMDGHANRILSERYEDAPEDQD